MNENRERRHAWQWIGIEEAVAQDRGAQEHARVQLLLLVRRSGRCWAENRRGPAKDVWRSRAESVRRRRDGAQQRVGGMPSQEEDRVTEQV